MFQSGTFNSYPFWIAVIGDFVPRQWGIATFTTDLLAGLSSENPVGVYRPTVMDDVPQGYRYPSQVHRHEDVSLPSIAWRNSPQRFESICIPPQGKVRDASLTPRERHLAAYCGYRSLSLVLAGNPIQSEAEDGRARNGRQALPRPLFACKKEAVVL